MMVLRLGELIILSNFNQNLGGGMREYLESKFPNVIFFVSEELS